MKNNIFHIILIKPPPYYYTILYTSREGGYHKKIKTRAYDVDILWPSHVKNAFVKFHGQLYSKTPRLRAKNCKYLIFAGIWRFLTASVRWIHKKLCIPAAFISSFLSSFLSSFWEDVGKTNILVEFADRLRLSANLMVSSFTVHNKYCGVTFVWELWEVAYHPCGS